MLLSEHLAMMLWVDSVIARLPRHVWTAERSLTGARCARSERSQDQFRNISGGAADVLYVEVIRPFTAGLLHLLFIDLL